MKYSSRRIGNFSDSQIIPDHHSCTSLLHLSFLLSFLALQAKSCAMSMVILNTCEI